MLVAFLVEAAAGFGGTVITVALASQLLPVDDILARILPVNMVLSAYVVLRHRRHVDGRLLFARILPWMGVGLVAGYFVARSTSPGWLKIAFAVFVLGLAVLELVALKRKVAPKKLPSVFAAGALLGAGVLHGLFACGGPLAVWTVGREVDDKGVFRATLSALWLALNVFLLVGFVVDTKISAVTLRESLVLLPPLLLGIVLGERVHARLSAERFRVGIFGLLFVAALVLLVRSIFAA